MNIVNTERGDHALTEEPHLGVLLERARRRLFDGALERFHDAGFGDLRLAHYAAMAFLPESGARLTTLAQRARMTKQSMGELLMDLEERGYVERRPDPLDRRAKIIVFTERGRAANRAGIAVLKAAEERISSKLGSERIAQLREILHEVDAMTG